MNKTEVKFRKQLTHFSKEGYDNALKHSRSKRELLTKCIAWIGKYIKHYNIEEFQCNMVGYFYTELAKQKKEFASLKIRPEKIADLLDINVTELSRLQEQYENHTGSIKFVDGVVEDNVDEEDYKQYTENDKQNEELKIAKVFIKGVQELSKVRQVVPNWVSQWSAGLIQYDGYTKEYYYKKPIERFR